jgi:hypothetical protein
LQFDTSTIVLAFLAGIACLAILIVVVAVPILTQFAGTLEALSMLMEGLGDYFGNTRLVWLGCTVIALTIVGCCVLGVVGGGVLVTCFSGNPVQVCRLIGR